VAEQYDWEHPDERDDGGAHDNPTGTGSAPPPVPPPNNEPCPGGPNWARNQITGECIELFPGDDDPSSNGCGPNQHWDEGQKRCVAGASGSGQQQSNGAYQPPRAPSPTRSPYDAAMSQTLFDNLTRMINGEGAPFSPEMVARMQAAALQSNRSQLASGQRDVQRRLIASGLSRSGVAPATQARFRGAADVDLSNNLRSIASTAVQKNYEAKVTALNQAQAFLQSERANSLSQDQLILSYARLNQEWKTTQATFDQQWKLVQNGNEQEMMKILLCLRTGAC
jgi:hypothetical protein